MIEWPPSFKRMSIWAILGIIGAMFLYGIGTYLIYQSYLAYTSIETQKAIKKFTPGVTAPEDDASSVHLCLTFAGAIAIISGFVFLFAAFTLPNKTMRLSSKN